MSLEIVTMPLGIANTNAYIIGDNDAKQAVVVDPVDRADLILIAAGTRGWQIRLILATHGHFDHVLASRDLKAATNAVFAAHKDTKPWLDMLPQQGTLFGLGEFSPAGELDELLDDDAPDISLAGIRLRPLFTPGHAPGHLAFVCDALGVVFAGDTLFAGSIGRTDLPGGDHQLLLRSIREQLLTLPDTTRVLPGHMEETTIGAEKRTNPFLRS